MDDDGLAGFVARGSVGIMSSALYFWIEMVW